jgi:hypothetical protein
VRQIGRQLGELPLERHHRLELTDVGRALRTLQQSFDRIEPSAIQQKSDVKRLRLTSSPPSACGCRARRGKSGDSFYEQCFVKPFGPNGLVNCAGPDASLAILGIITGSPANVWQSWPIAA